MGYRTIGYEAEDRIATITLNRPRYRNAQSRVMLEELDQAFERAAHDPGVHVICLFGEGDHFCSGHDLGSPDEMADRERRPIAQGIRGRYAHSTDLHFNLTWKWRNHRKPTIAGVQGYCISAGWMLASAMDVIFAAEDALFLGGLFQFFTIPWDIPTRRAKEILFEGRFIDAREAHDLGLVNRVLGNADLRPMTLAYAREVAANDPFEMAMTKLALNQADDARGFGAHVGSAHLANLMTSVGYQDDSAAFVQKGGRSLSMVERAMQKHKAKKD